jgi:hypothetical protein
MDEQPIEVQLEYQAWLDSTRQCPDDDCLNGVIVGPTYLAFDGSVNWSETPCPICAPVIAAECDDETIPF